MSVDDTVTCKICRRQFSKYTCPTCNIPYCSLTCFRAESHAQCSETFYKKEVESEIQTAPSKTAQERLKMMEILKKFEEESSATPDVHELEEDDDADATELEQRFQSIDLESTSSDTIWSMLTPEEQVKFRKALEDPSSELAQQLLASEEMEKERKKPWWEASAVDEDDIEAGSRQTFGAEPLPLNIPPAMIERAPNGPSLIYNLCAICIVYAYITRHLATSPLATVLPNNADTQQARQLISQLVPFLVERKSTILHKDLSGVVTDLWSRFDEGVMTSELFSLLLRDACQILRPRRVVSVDIHPHNVAMLVISDLHRLFAGSTSMHISHKLVFYAAHALTTPSVVLEVAAREMEKRAGSLGE